MIVNCFRYSWRKEQKDLRDILRDEFAKTPENFPVREDAETGKLEFQPFSFSPFVGAGLVGYRKPSQMYSKGVFGHESQRSLFLCSSSVKTKFGGVDEANHEEIAARVSLCRKLISTQPKVKSAAMKEIKKFQSIWEALKARHERREADEAGDEAELLKEGKFGKLS